MTSSPSSTERASTLSALSARHTTLTAGAIAHLHRLLGEWQTLADLAFADLLLYAPTRDDRLVIVAQVRPYPAQTLYPEDLVGTVVERTSRAKVVRALTKARIVREGDPDWRDGVPVREEAVPVVLGAEVLAVISVEQNLASARTPSHLELAYLRAAGDLEQMICEGTFPDVSEEPVERELSPRVGDGFLEIDPAGVITYASPNAVSAYRRLGVSAISGGSLREIGVGHKRVHDAMLAHRPTEDEVHAEDAWVLRRFIPVVVGGELRGCLGLVRDVTESRQRDRLISIQDARLREIHHRVKNNLQTVASLLRIQARRMQSPEARIQLEESVQRIRAIALVHETLAADPNQEVGFDEVARRLTAMVTGSLVRAEAPVRAQVEGRGGDLPIEIATPVALILTELLQNACEHAFRDRGGTVMVRLGREDGTLIVEVADDGVGLPEGFSLDTHQGLGLQIVGTLAAELNGEVRVEPAAPGARFVVTIPVG